MEAVSHTQTAVCWSCGLRVRGLLTSEWRSLRRLWTALRRSGPSGLRDNASIQLQGPLEQGRFIQSLASPVFISTHRNYQTLICEI